MTTAAADYLLIFRETTPERYDAMSKEQLRQALDRWNAWCDDLVAQGKLQGGNSLSPEARFVTGAASNRPVDGPFAEAKELIGGYFLLKADSLDEATAIAEQCPNRPYGMVVEVRAITPACHLARRLGWATTRGPAAQPA